MKTMRARLPKDAAAEVSGHLGPRILRGGDLEEGFVAEGKPWRAQAADAYRTFAQSLPAHTRALQARVEKTKTIALAALKRSLPSR